MLHADMSARSGLNSQSDYFVYFCADDRNGPYNNYTFVSATMTMSHYYSDIGTIEVDAYINTQRAPWTRYKLSTAAK